MYTYKANKFAIGDKVMRRADYVKSIYTVVNPYAQTRERIVIQDQFGNTERVSQNAVRGLSRAELSVCNAYRKLVEDVDEGR